MAVSFISFMLKSQIDMQHLLELMILIVFSSCGKHSAKFGHLVKVRL